MADNNTASDSRWGHRYSSLQNATQGFPSDSESLNAIQSTQVRESLLRVLVVLGVCAHLVVNIKGGFQWSVT